MVFISSERGMEMTEEQKVLLRVCLRCSEEMLVSMVTYLQMQQSVGVYVCMKPDPS